MPYSTPDTPDMIHLVSSINHNLNLLLFLLTVLVAFTVVALCCRVVYKFFINCGM